MTPDPARTSEKLADLTREIIGTFVAEGWEREQLHVVGFPAVITVLLEETLFNLVRLFPIVSILLLFCVWFLFRRLWPAFVSMGVAGVAVLWTMGLGVAMDPRVTVLHSIAPVVILIVSF